MSTPANYIHYNPERVDYTVTESELDQLCRSSNSWKDFTIAAGGVGIPCILNAISIYQAQTTFTPTLAFILNLLVGLVGIALGIAFGIMWSRTTSDINAVKTTIKNKPRIPFQAPAVSNIGQLPTASSGPLGTPSSPGPAP